MNRKSWTALALAVLMILTAAAAAADVYPLKKGSKGDEVKALQEMLIDLGFLNDKADGIFGSKTEAAVEAWQAYRGAEQTGRMSEEAMTVLDDTWGRVMDVATEANVSEEELKDIFGEGCCPFEEDGVTHFEYCWRHYRVMGLADLLQAGGMPEVMENRVAERLQQLWLGYIPALFDEWEASLPDAQKYVAQEQHSNFDAALEEMREEWKTGGQSPLTAEALWLNEIGAGLCFDLYTAEGNTP